VGVAIELAAVVALAVAGMIRPALKWLNPEKAMRGYLSKASLAILGFLVSQVHLLLFDRRFLARGRLRRLLDLKPSGGHS
jgi:hypothetical protein